MAHPDYVREKAVQMRAERKLTIDEIAERLALPRTTIFYWVKNIPIETTPAQSAARQRASDANSEKHRKLRDAAYQRGLAEFADFDSDPTFRDFVTLFIAEGHKRSRHGIAIANSDPAVIRVSLWWFERLSNRKITFQVQHHADQQPKDLQQFWASELGIWPDEVVCFEKSNSGQLRSRTWRCVNGVMSVRTSDTYLRARMQAWTDRLREEWVSTLVACSPSQLGPGLRVPHHVISDLR